MPHLHVTKEKGTLICEECSQELYEEINHEQEWRHFADADGRGEPDPSRCQFRKAPEKGIKRELDRMEFAPDVCELADHLYMMITGGEMKRSDLRKGIMFACLGDDTQILTYRFLFRDEVVAAYNVDPRGFKVAAYDTWLKGITYQPLCQPPTVRDEGMHSMVRFCSQAEAVAWESKDDPYGERCPLEVVTETTLV